MNGVAPLLKCARGPEPLLRKNALKALKNLSHRDRSSPSSSDENKRAIKDGGGIPTLADRMKNAQDPAEASLAAAVLWNLSACEDLKDNILDDADVIPHIINYILLPGAKFDPDASNNCMGIHGLTTSDNLKNALGVLRNASSAGGRDPGVRTRLRNWDGFVEALIRIINSAILDYNQDSKDDEKHDINEKINSKVIENCACTLRNLSYRTQEIRDGPEYDNDDEKGKSKENILSADANDAKEKKKKSAKDDSFLTTKANPRGAELLWHTDTIQMYVTLLESSLNATTLAAAGGALQNLCACGWKPASEIRSLVRRKRALPILVDMLTLQDERAVCAMTWALRNLIAGDATNRQLVGRYGVGNLAALLPPTETPPPGTIASTPEGRHSEETIFAALSTIAEVVHKNKTAAQELVTKQGLSRTVAMTRTSGKYTEKTLKMAALVLRRLWLIKSLQKTYKSQGYVQEDFNVTTLQVAKSPEESAFNQRNDTLFRQNKPSQSEDATLKKQRKGKGKEDTTATDGIALTDGTAVKGGRAVNGESPSGETSV